MDRLTIELAVEETLRRQQLYAMSGDAAAAILARVPDVRLGVGSYDVTSGVTLAEATILQGRGKPDFQYAAALTELVSSSPTANGITLTEGAVGSTLEKFGVRNTSATPPTAGAGIYALLDEGSFVLRDVHSHGFYDGAVVGGRGFIVDGYVCSDPVRYGMVVGNPTSDHGLGVIQNAFLYTSPSGLRGGQAGFRWENGGGCRVQHLKVGQYLGGNQAAAWVNGVEVHGTSLTDTGEIEFGDVVIDEYTGTGISVYVEAGGKISSLRFSDVLLSRSALPTWGVNLDAAAGPPLGALNRVAFDDVSINMGQHAGVQGGAFFNNVNNLSLDGLAIIGVPADKPRLWLGNHCYSTSVRLGPLGYQSNAAQWPTGQAVLILQCDGVQEAAFAGGAHDIEFPFQSPTITSNSVYSNVWQLDVGSRPVMVEFTGLYNTSGGNKVAVHQRRLLSRPTGAATNVVATAVGTDAEGPANEVDVQWTGSGRNMTIGVKIDPASGATSLSGYSSLRIVGMPTKVTAYT